MFIKKKEMQHFDIYEEGFSVMEGDGHACYIGSADGETFLDACKSLMKKIGRGEIRTGDDGREYACDW